MHWGRINHTLQIGANLGILLGLILVAVQISETNRITNAQFIADDYSVSMQSFDLMIGENLPDAWARANANSKDLTDEDIVVIRAFLHREWLRSIRERNIAATGVKEFDMRTEVAGWVYQYLGNETALLWWEDPPGVVNAFPELRDAIEEELMEVSDSHSELHKRRIEATRKN